MRQNYRAESNSRVPSYMNAARIAFVQEGFKRHDRIVTNIHSPDSPIHRHVDSKGELAKIVANSDRKRAAHAILELSAVSVPGGRYRVNVLARREQMRLPNAWLDAGVGDVAGH
ncbi:MAG: hypothetical protein ACYC8V_01945 [Caulobacteraceae bacterium]